MARVAVAQSVPQCVHTTTNYTNVAADISGPADSCRDQAACLDVHVDSSTCVTATESGTSYLYCRVCILWSDARNCPKDVTATVDHVCAGDEVFYPGFISNAGAAPVMGVTNKTTGWRAYSADRYCQWARWTSTQVTTDVVFTVKDGTGSCLRGFVCVSTDDADDVDHCQGTSCGSLYANLIANAWKNAPLDADGILAVGNFYYGTDAYYSLVGWAQLAGIPASKISFATTPYDVVYANLNQYKVLYVPSDAYNTWGGITIELNDALISIKSKIKDFVNVRGGSMIVLTQAGFTNRYDPSTGRTISTSFSFLPTPFTYVPGDFYDATITSEMTKYSPYSTNA
ncbi:hypothetical protein GPECTOR_644g756 [Gonium pectorale]|uniref:Uncharacterized protein n=1 Tax=Gonium pectorale TaxID=33097 RepID=A0A150FVI9_GONPE|nr:hypothetical protein GPECTOR_644g756 [Gonium pectorale]|eukprot:KXZ41215.1 hypothetical protein GPECTOR_644g756 [Gonium pectorale]